MHFEKSGACDCLPITRRYGQPLWDIFSSLHLNAKIPDLDLFSSVVIYKIQKSGISDPVFCDFSQVSVGNTAFVLLEVGNTVLPTSRF